MKTFSQTIRAGLPLIAGLALWGGHAQAAPAGPLALLSAKLQAAPLENSGKHLSGALTPTAAMSALAAAQQRLAGTAGASKLLPDVPLTTSPPPSKSAVPTQLRRLAGRLSKDALRSAKPKQLSTQISASPDLE